MKRIIEVEETVKLQHHIVVEYNDDESLDRAIEYMNEACLGSAISSINDYVTVLHVNENVYEDSEGIEFIADYEYHDALA